MQMLLLVIIFIKQCHVQTLISVLNMVAQWLLPELCEVGYCYYPHIRNEDIKQHVWDLAPGQWRGRSQRQFCFNPGSASLTKLYPANVTLE